MDKKDYKENCSFVFMKRGASARRGQIAIFVILAIVVVAIVLAVAFFPGFNVVTSGELNPTVFLRDCVEPQLDETLTKLNAQGGYLQPEHFVAYEGTHIQYLCYTDANYEPCKVQQPLLVGHYENEIKKEISPVARECVGSLADAYERRGYEVQTTPGEVEVDIKTGEIVVDFLTPMTVTRDSVDSFQRFAVSKETEIYDLLLTAVSIVQFESTLGDSETTLYIQYYPDLKIEKIRRSPDTIYKLSNVVTGDEFSFATRSLVWPQGYGLEEL